ncbi:MAG: tetratricopeptide repeat protein [Candidatus Nitrospinota bacterium M3_3B_026]
MTSARALVAAAFFLAAAAPPFQPASAAAADKPASREAGERLEALEDRIREDPNDLQAVFEKAVLLAGMNRIEEAKALYEGLISDYPNIPEPYNNLAALYASEGRLVEARNLLETVTNSHPSLAVAHENLGDVYAALAVAEYGKLKELGEESETSRRKLKAILGVAEYITFTGELAGKVEPEGETAPPEEAGESTEKKTVVAEPGPLVIVPFDQTPPEEDVTMVLENWARAWTKMEADRFLSFYGEDYAVSGDTPENWREKTRQSIKGREWIKAKVEDIDIEMLGPRQARASLTLKLSSDKKEETVESRSLTLAKIKGRWVIIGDEKEAVAAEQ